MRLSGGVRPCGVGSRSPRPPVRPPAGSAKVPLRCVAGRRGAETMGRGAGGTALPRAAGTPRGRRVGAPRGVGGEDTGHPGTASAHLDEKLDEGLFVLLLQPIQGHRQRHGRLGWAPRTAATAVGCGSGAAVAAASRRTLSLALFTRSLDSPDVKLPAGGHRSSAPPHASRATRRGLRSQLLQTAGRDPVGVVWAGQRPGASDSAGGVGGTGRGGAASGEEGGGERFGFPNGPLQSPEDRGAWPRLGSADWRGGAVSHAPRGGRAWSPEPEPDTASLRREAASSAAVAGWVPGDLMQRPASRPLPRCRRRTHRLPRPFPGRRPPRLLQLGAAAFSWKTFAKVFMSLRSTFFSSSSDCGHPLGMLLY